MLDAFRSPRFWITLLILSAINIFIVNVLLAPQQPKQVTLPYNVFKAQIADDNVSDVTLQGTAVTGDTRKPVSAPGSSDTSTHFTTRVPSIGDSELLPLMQQHNVTINVKAESSDTPAWLTALLSFGPSVLLLVGFLWLMRRSTAAAGGGLFGFGQSRARLYDPERPSTTFGDVAGIDEAKAELQEVVDFLREPQRYQRLGGTVPKGVLLVGPPGTGKTLLARAVAGEAKVPFFSVSASEFIEMIVGVGASRVRDLFNKARQAAPAIVFIDELDAIGRSRAGAVRIGSDEQEQTLNQILTEMDGFDSREGVIVLAATNRADVLDSALLRPGRFDRRVMVQPPDRAGRVAILKIHTRSVPLAPDVDFDQLARETAGFVGADLRNLVNEAALNAAKTDRSSVTMEDFSEAVEKVLLGAERRIMITKQDRERVAYHEGGHALLGLLVPGADPVRKVTIVPRGRALGVTVQSPVDDRFNYSEDYLRARIVGALGGRAAERLVYGSVTTGAENDLQQVTMIAREMVTRWGMSPKVGPLSLSSEGDGAGPPLLGAQRPFSEATAALIDEEIKRIVEECQREAERLLTANRDKLNALAEALLREESLDEQEILRVTGLSPHPEEAAQPARA